MGREAIVPGGNRRVRGEDRLAGDAAHGLFQRQPLADHPLPHEFQRGEGAMPFVQMNHARHDAQRLERPHAADAEQQLLANPHALSPPYSRDVSSRSSGGFPSTSESSRSSVLRPTANCQTRATIVRPFASAGGR